MKVFGKNWFFIFFILPQQVHHCWFINAFQTIVFSICLYIYILYIYIYIYIYSPTSTTQVLIILQNCYTHGQLFAGDSQTYLGKHTDLFIFFFLPNLLPLFHFFFLSFFLLYLLSDFGTPWAWNMKATEKLESVVYLFVFWSSVWSFHLLPWSSCQSLLPLSTGWS